MKGLISVATAVVATATFAYAGYSSEYRTDYLGEQEDFHGPQHVLHVNPTFSAGLPGGFGRGFGGGLDNSFGGGIPSGHGNLHFAESNHRGAFGSPPGGAFEVGFRGGGHGYRGDYGEFASSTDIGSVKEVHGPTYLVRTSGGRDEYRTYVRGPKRRGRKRPKVIVLKGTRYEHRY